MRKKIIAAILIMANVLSLASCSIFNKPDDDNDPDETGETTMSTSEEKVFETVEKIGKALAECDYGKFKENCSKESRDIEKAMPSISNDNDDDYKKQKVTDNWRVRNMIAATITYKIDEKSFKSGFWGKDCSVDVVFSYKDYHEVLGMREEFLGPADFNTLLYDVEKTIDTKVTLKFKKDGRNYLLENPDDLLPLYEYEKIDDMKFLKNYFSLIKNTYMTGPGWDPVTESYTDTNTFTIVFELDDRAKNYIWRYKYAVSEGKGFDWDYKFISAEINDEYPTEIRLTFSQDENFKTGFYHFFLYDPQTKSIYGLEYDVYNTQDGGKPTETSESTTETTT